MKYTVYYRQFTSLQKVMSVGSKDFATRRPTGAPMELQPMLRKLRLAVGQQELAVLHRRRCKEAVKQWLHNTVVAMSRPWQLLRRLHDRAAAGDRWRRYVGRCASERRPSSPSALDGSARRKSEL